MKITNKLGLPQPFVNVATPYEPTPGHYSATSLLMSPRQFWLSRRHNDLIEEDVADRIWTLFGTAVHYVLQEGGEEDALTEEYLSAPFGDILVTGIADHYKDKTITDYKTTSVWSIIYGSRMEEWEEQLNIYAYLYRQSGFEVENIQVNAILRDWQKSKVRDDNYPENQVVKVPLTTWDEETQKRFITLRVTALNETKDLDDNSLPYCTDKERWKDPAKWAIMKKGRKRAVKLCHSEEEAELIMETLDEKHYLEERPSVARKCADYCSVNIWCKQYQDEIS